MPAHVIASAMRRPGEVCVLRTMRDSVSRHSVRRDFSRRRHACPVRARLHCLHVIVLSLSRGLRRLLHGTVDRLAHSRHARRQTGGRSLRATGRGIALPPVRASGTPAVLRHAQARTGDVRPQPPGGHGLPGRAGAGHPALRTPDASQLTVGFSFLPPNMRRRPAPMATTPTSSSFQNLASTRPILANRPALAASPPPTSAARP